MQQAKGLIGDDISAKDKLEDKAPVYRNIVLHEEAISLCGRQRSSQLINNFLATYPWSMLL